MVAQGIARLEGEMQAVRALLGNSSTILAALREVATPSTAIRCFFAYFSFESMLECEADADICVILLMPCVSKKL